MAFRTLAEAAGALKRQSRWRDGPVPALFLMTDSVRLPDPRPVACRLPRGSGIVVRHYDDPGRERLACDLVTLGRARKLTILVAGDWRLARRTGADGVHLPEYLSGRAAQARHAGDGATGWIVTAAVHSARAAWKASEAGANAVFLSPVFPTKSHPQAEALGPLRFARIASGLPRPVIALGGITAKSAPRLIGSGAAGIAAIGGLAD